MEIWVLFLAVLCYGHSATDASPLRTEWTGLDDPWGLLKILRTGYKGERVSLDGQDQHMEIENLHQKCYCPGDKPIGCECKEKIILRNDDRGRFPKSNGINSQTYDVRQLPFTKRENASPMLSYIKTMSRDSFLRVLYETRKNDEERNAVLELIGRRIQHIDED